MDEILQLTLLYDFYGELLTDKQKQTFELHYHNDLSLTEIGQEIDSSRQAVRDLLKRTEKILLEYEGKLQLVRRFLEQKKAIQTIKTIIQDVERKEILSPFTIAEIEKIKNIADEILD